MPSTSQQQPQQQQPTELDAAQEAQLYSVVALAGLFRNTVESFGLIQTSQSNVKDEKVLLTQLGVEQARLLIWGDIVGVCAPPATIATHAIPSNPGPTYPDVNEPMYFGPRDSRIDRDDVRANVESALDAIANRLSHTDPAIMKNFNGLKPWQRGVPRFSDQPAFDAARFDSLEEKYSLLLDVAESRAAMERPHRDTTQQWLIHDTIRFANFVKHVKQQVDKLVTYFDVNDKVERAMKLDIKLLGWHPESASGKPSRSTAADMSKLKFLIRACRARYPAFVEEAQAALAHLDEESGLAHATARKLSIGDHDAQTQTPGSKSAPASPSKAKRPGLLTRLSTWRGAVKSGRKTPTPSRPASPEPAEEEDAYKTPRTRSASGLPSSAAAGTGVNDLEPSRSKSFSQVPDRPVSNDWGVLDPVAVEAQEELARAGTKTSMVSRHDMYR